MRLFETWARRGLRMSQQKADIDSDNQTRKRTDSHFKSSEKIAFWVAINKSNDPSSKWV